MGLSSRIWITMSPIEVMKRTLVPLALYSPAGEVSGVTDGNGLLEEEVGDGDGEGFSAWLGLALCEMPRSITPIGDNRNGDNRYNRCCVRLSV